MNGALPDGTTANRTRLPAVTTCDTGWFTFDGAVDFTWTPSMCVPAAIRGASENVMVVDAALAVKLVLNLRHLYADNVVPFSSSVAMTCESIETVRVLCNVGRGEW